MKGSNPVEQMHGSEFWSEAGTILVEAAEQYFCISFPIFWEINLAAVKRKTLSMSGNVFMIKRFNLKEAHSSTMTYQTKWMPDKFQIIT